MSDGPSRPAQVADRPLRRDRPAVVRLVRRELVEQLRPQVGVDEDLARFVALGRVAAADAVRQDRGSSSRRSDPSMSPISSTSGSVRGIDLGRLRVDVDDPLRAVRIPRRRRVLDEVVPDADDEVRAIEAGQDVVARLQPDGHQRQVRAIVDGALAHERRGDRHVQPAGERPQLRRGAATEDPVAGQDDRPFRGGDQARGVGDGLVGRLGEVGTPRRERHGHRCVRRERGRGDVLRQLDVGRPGLLERRDPEGLAHDLGDALGLLDPRVPLRDGLEHPHDVDDLVGLLVELGRGRLAGDRDHRRAVQERVGHAGDEVRGARTERAHRDRGTAGQAAVDVGHERRALLVAGRDVADGFVARQRVEDVHRLLAGHREDVVAALGGEAVDEEVGGAPGRARGGRHRPPRVGHRATIRRSRAPRPDTVRYARRRSPKEDACARA